MANFRYRAATATGELRSGDLEAASASGALEQIRRLGLTPIEASESRPAVGKSGARLNAQGRLALGRAIAELAVLLSAGLALERALSICTENAQRPVLRAAFAELHAKVKSGSPLSRAMAESRGLFPPMAVALAEAGEADGRLHASLASLAETMERSETLRQTIASAMVYPIMLLTVAFGVILVMLLVVVPQFEGLFSDGDAKLPAMTRMVVGASHLVRTYGLPALLALGGAVAVGLQWLKRPQARLTLDRALLRTPRLGALARDLEIARFARVLGGLIDGGVPLPSAMAIARRSVVNTHMGEAIGKVASGLKIGSGLSGPLAATGVMPPMAIGFLRTGEETARLGPMLNRLADVLDRDVRVSVQALIALLTPVITIVMGLIVASVIASLITAILGFNDLALAP